MKIYEVQAVTCHPKVGDPLSKASQQPGVPNHVQACRIQRGWRRRDHGARGSCRGRSHHGCQGRHRACCVG